MRLVQEPYYTSLYVIRGSGLIYEIYMKVAKLDIENNMFIKVNIVLNKV